MNPTTSNGSHDKQLLYRQVANYVKLHEISLNNYPCLSKLSLFEKAGWKFLLSTALFPYIEGLTQLNANKPSLFKGFLGFLNANGNRISENTPIDLYASGYSIILCTSIAFNIRELVKSTLPLKEQLTIANETNRLIDRINSNPSGDLAEEDTKLINQLNETEIIRQRLNNRSKWSIIGGLVCNASLLVMLGVMVSATHTDLSKDYNIKQLFCSALYFTAGSGLYCYTKMRQNDIDVQFLSKMNEILNNMLPKANM